MFSRLSAARSLISHSSPVHPVFAARNGWNKFQHASVLQKMERDAVKESVRSFSRFSQSSSFQNAIKRSGLSHNATPSSLLHLKLAKQQHQARSESSLSFVKPQTQNQKNVYLAGGLLALGIVYFILNKTLNQVSVNDTQRLSPGVRKYLAGTYAYLTGGIALSAATAIAAWRSNAVMGLMYKYPIGFCLVTSLMCFAALIGTRMVDPRNVVLKNSLYTVFCAIEGVTLASLGFAGGPVIQKAALYTLGIFFAMSMIAMTAKHERFLYLGGPIFVGMSLMIVASFASLGLSFFGKMPRTALALEAFIMWGGLLLFTAALLYHTQSIIARGKQFEALRDASVVSSSLSTTGGKQVAPDYIGEALRLYLDLSNIFIRLVLIFSNSNRKK